MELPVSLPFPPGKRKETSVVMFLMDGLARAKYFFKSCYHVEILQYKTAVIAG